MLTRAPLVAAARAWRLAFVGTSVVMARFVNINTFSLHGMYRDRLIRAYLGASNAARRASPFTGFAAERQHEAGRPRPAGRGRCTC